MIYKDSGGGPTRKGANFVVKKKMFPLKLGTSKYILFGTEKNDRNKVCS